MDPSELIASGSLLHGHACPPLVLGLRAGSIAMTRLGVGRALGRELFAMVELGSDHYAQGFADGIQLVTSCTFGKELIIRVPHGKMGVRLVDQPRGRAVRVVPRPEAITSLERTDWFHACASSGMQSTECAERSGSVIHDLLAAPEDALFEVSAVFPLGIEDQRPSFESLVCEACGESVLASYARDIEGRRICIPCDERRPATQR